MSKQNHIEELVSDLTPVKPVRSPGRKGLLAGLGLLVLVGALMMLLDPFRPAWLSQLASSPRFQIGIRESTSRVRYTSRSGSDPRFRARSSPMARATSFS